jgi:hypothetical protein
MARICILFLTLAAAALGQTSADLSAKYPNVITYRIRPHVLMTARFASDGQVCEMTLEKGQLTDTSIPFVDSFSNEEVHSLVDDLAPEGQRGRDMTRRFDGSIEGLGYTSVYTYENVLVHVYGTMQVEAGQVGATGNKVIVITWRSRTCSAVKTAAR